MSGTRRRLNWDKLLRFIHNTVDAGALPVFRKGVDYTNPATFKMMCKKKLAEFGGSIKLEPFLLGNDAVAVLPTEVNTFVEFPCFVFFGATNNNEGQEDVDTEETTESVTDKPVYVAKKDPNVKVTMETQEEEVPF
jgi:hypothetical protein